MAEIPAELKAILDHRAGKVHSDEGPVMACLAEILAEHRLMVLRDSFEGRVSLDEMAAAQGVQPVQDIADLHSGMEFSDEDFEAFQGALRASRGQCCDQPEFRMRLLATVDKILADLEAKERRRTADSFLDVFTLDHVRRTLRLHMAVLGSREAREHNRQVAGEAMSRTGPDERPEIEARLEALLEKKVREKVAQEIAAPPTVFNRAQQERDIAIARGAS